MRAVFAENLAKQRQRCGLSQRQAASDLQVSQALLSHYEKGIREPGLDFVVRAAEYYGVSTDALLGAPTVRRKSKAAEDAQQVIWDCMGAIFQLQESHYDPDIYRYTVAYLGAVLYELIRHGSRLCEDQAPDWFTLSDESFDSGAVVSDLTWIRAKFILAVRQLGEQPDRPPVNRGILTPEVRASLGKLVRMVEGRILDQELAEEGRTTDLAQAFFIPEEEDPT